VNKLQTALLVLLIGIAGLSPAIARETRAYFKDWLAACRDDGYCSATAYDNPNPPSGIVADYILRVGRADQGVYWEISVSTVASMPGDFPEFQVKVDDRSFSFQPPFDVRAYGAINDFYFQNDEAQKLLDAMGPGHELSVSFTDDKGTQQTAHFSLDGLNAALLWIDDHQHRLGSERVAGAAPVGLTPVSRDYPANVPAALLRQFAGDEDCDPFETLPNAGDIIQIRSGGNKVWFLPCSAGAYNFLYKAFEDVNGGYQPLLWAEYSDTLGWTGTPYIVNPNYDAGTGILTSFFKGRGVGDCGSAGTWHWTGSAFKMVEYLYKGTCDGKGGIETFDKVFKAKTGSEE